MRQKREREEKKRERVINEINDRQMGKILKSASANIDIGSAEQFPECGNFNDMPALASSASERSISPTLSCSPATSGFPSFATVNIYFASIFFFFNCGNINFALIFADANISNNKQQI
jgi:hypothetical protein